MIGKITTREIEDLTTDDGKNAAAVALGRMMARSGPSGVGQEAEGDREEYRCLKMEAGLATELYARAFTNIAMMTLYPDLPDVSSAISLFSK